MAPSRISRPSRPGRDGMAMAAGAVLLAGCASTQLDAQWAAPDRLVGTLRGERVWVACEAREAVIRQMCQEQLAAEVTARGATAVMSTGSVPPPGDAAHLDAARVAGARAALVGQVAPYGSRVSPGFSVGIGGFGVGSGGFGGGVGVSAPIGGGQITTGYALDTRLTDARTGRLLWTAKASSPPSQNPQAQLSELTRTVFGSADKLGVF